MLRWSKNKSIPPKIIIKSGEVLTSTSYYKYESDYIFDDIWFLDKHLIKGDLVLITDPLLPMVAICTIDAIIEPGVIFKLSLHKGLVFDVITYKVIRSISKEEWIYLEFEFIKKDNIVDRFKQDYTDNLQWKVGTQKSVFAGQMNKFK